jgi:hypothetical protein
MNPLVHTGDSANIAYYAEEPKRDGYIWAEVLRSDVYWTGSGQRRRSRVRAHPRCYITVYRIGTGQLAERKYIPRNHVPPGPLDAATVTRLVRAMLKGTS